MNHLIVKNVTKKFLSHANGSKEQALDSIAVNDISFNVAKGETFAIVGESGSGKTTLAFIITKFIRANHGAIFFNGQDIIKMNYRKFQSIRPKIQIIFQNPAKALNPRQTLGNMIQEPLKFIKGLRGKELDKRIDDLIEAVGLEKELKSRLPHELSGGQQQRAAIARALSTDPELLIADEPTSSLDAIYTNQIISLLKNLQDKFGITLILISHDLNIVEEIADRVAVMYNGRFVEIADKYELYSNPVHPYSKILLENDLNGNKIYSSNILKSGSFSGCDFVQNCPAANEQCQIEIPGLKKISSSRSVFCHFPNRLNNCFDDLFVDEDLITNNI